jgi:dCTP deaminase
MTGNKISNGHDVIGNGSTQCSDKFSGEDSCPMHRGLLSDYDIKYYWGKGIDIYTVDNYPDFEPEKQIQPGSVDLRFRNEFKRFSLKDGDTLSRQTLINKSYTEPFDLKADDKLIINPGEIILTTTLEEVHFSNDFAGFITGRSSMARLGLMVQCCQDFINPGNRQAIALQLVNLSPYPIELEMYSAICQLIVFRLCTSATHGYTDNPNSKYANETGPIPSRIFQDNPVNKKNNTIIKWLKKWIEPLLPSLVIGTVFMAFVYNVVKERPIKDIFKLITEIPAGIIIGIVVVALYIFLKLKDDENR